jgi:hypothetical protein
MKFNQLRSRLAERENERNGRRNGDGSEVEEGIKENLNFWREDSLFKTYPKKVQHRTS